MSIERPERLEGDLNAAERELLHRLPSACPPRMPAAKKLIGLGLARAHGTINVAGEAKPYDFVVITTRGHELKGS